MFDNLFVLIISIIKYIMAIFIDISATLKIGNSKGTRSKKSTTYPLKSLSIPLPNVPPNKYAIPFKFQLYFNLIGISFEFNWNLIGI